MVHTVVKGLEISKAIFLKCIPPTQYNNLRLFLFDLTHLRGQERNALKKIRLLFGRFKAKKNCVLKFPDLFFLKAAFNRVKLSSNKQATNCDHKVYYNIYKSIYKSIYVKRRYFAFQQNIIAEVSCSKMRAEL